MAEAPFIYDAVKLDILRWECSSGIHRYVPQANLGALAGIVGQLVRTAQGQKISQNDTAMIWLPGNLGYADFECLLNLVEPDLRYMKNKQKWKEIG